MPASLRHLLSLALLLTSMMALAAPTHAEAQQNEYFSGQESGDFGQFRYDSEPPATCLKVRDVESVGDRTCTYQCNSGESFTRTQSRTRFCAGALTLNQRELQRELSGGSPSRCTLRRFRLTQTDRLCLYSCEGEDYVTSVTRSSTCPGLLTR